MDAPVFAARSIARTAMLDLRLRPERTPADYALTWALLGLAESYAPADVELVRRRAEAAFNAGDADAVERATRRLLELDPSDTVAQLRLISSRISRLQTADERLASYDRFLASGAIDASIRSRLALDAALLERERGRAASFDRYLARAIELDGTNKDAALLRWGMVESAEAPGSELRLGALLALLMADPLDLNVHTAVARELASTGAYSTARRFIENSRALLTTQGDQTWIALAVCNYVLRWHAGGVEKVVADLSKQVADQRAALQREIDKAMKEGLGVGVSDQKPEDVRLNMDFERIRLAGALALGDEKTIGDSLTDYSGSVAQRIALRSDDRSRPAGLTERNVAFENRAERLELQHWRGLANRDIDKARADLDALAAEDDGADLASARAWLTLRSGEAGAAELALAQFRAVPASADIAPGLTLAGEASALEAMGRKDEAIQTLARLARSDSLGALGAWARGRLIALGGSDPERSPAAQAASKLSERVPAWVDKMIIDPRTGQSLRVELVSPTVRGLEPSRIRVTLRNLTPLPLGLGSNRAMSSRLLFSPRAEVRMVSVPGFAEPEVIDLQRRLRVMPGESLIAEVTPDLGYFGLVLESAIVEPVRARWQVLQGFFPAMTGTMEVAKGSQIASTESLVRTPVAEARLVFDELLSRCERATDVDAPVLAAAVRARTLGLAALMGPIPAAGSSAASNVRPNAALVPTPEQSQRLFAALASRYAALSPMTRAILVCVVPSAVQHAEAKVFDEAVRAERDPAVLPLVLVTRVSAPTDELLSLENQPESVAVVIELLRERLSNSSGESAPGVPAIDSIARAGPGLLALRPKPLAGEQKAVDDVLVRPAPPSAPTPTSPSAPVPAPTAPPAAPASGSDSLLDPVPTSPGAPSGLPR
ncbi:MAG: hypothetical protein SFY95_08660 [Planctomycetota bacterium]|nr:hypothetical protein [Planctomycetota bacterium]